MKAIVIFIEEDAKIHLTDGLGDRKLDEHTDFKTESGLYDLLDITKHFKCTVLNYKQPYSVLRKVEALNMMHNPELTLDTEIIKERLFK